MASGCAAMQGRYDEPATVAYPRKAMWTQATFASAKYCWTAESIMVRDPRRSHDRRVKSYAKERGIARAVSSFRCSTACAAICSANSSRRATTCACMFLRPRLVSIQYAPAGRAAGERAVPGQELLPFLERSRLRFEVSHPFRKRRGMDGAPSYFWSRTFSVSRTAGGGFEGRDESAPLQFSASDGLDGIDFSGDSRTRVSTEEWKSLRSARAVRPAGRNTA